MPILWQLNRCTLCLGKLSRGNLHRCGMGQNSLHQSWCFWLWSQLPLHSPFCDVHHKCPSCQLYHLHFSGSVFAYLTWSILEVCSHFTSPSALFHRHSHLSFSLRDQGFFAPTVGAMAMPVDDLSSLFKNVAFHKIRLTNC